MGNTLNWLKRSWYYIKTRDFVFWSTVSTLLLVLITLFLALATKRMADVMLMDFKVRNMPVFWVSTSNLDTDETQTKISFSIKNDSEGIAKNAIHNVLVEIKAGLFAVQNIIVKRGKWAKRLNQIPFEYVAKSQENIKLHWPIKTHPLEGLDSMVIVLTYDTHI